VDFVGLFSLVFFSSHFCSEIPQRCEANIIIYLYYSATTMTRKYQKLLDRSKVKNFAVVPVSKVGSDFFVLFISLPSHDLSCVCDNDESCVYKYVVINDCDGRFIDNNNDRDRTGRWMDDIIFYSIELGLSLYALHGALVNNIILCADNGYIVIIILCDNPCTYPITALRCRRLSWMRLTVYALSIAHINII